MSGSPRRLPMSPCHRCVLIVACLCVAVALPWAAGAPEGPAPARADRHGDPLPAGAVARLGTSRLRHGQPVYSVAFSPDGSILASGGSDGRVVLWEAATGREMRQIALGPGVLNALVFTSDGKRLLTGGSGGPIRLLETATGKELRRFQGLTGQVSALALSPDDRFVVSAGPNPTLRLWDVDTGKEVRQFTAQRGAITSVVFCPDGKHFVSAGPDDGVRLWEAATGQMVRQFVSTAPGTPPQGADRVEALALARDGKTLAAGGP